MREAIRMPGRVCGRQESTPRVTYERDAVVPEVPPQRIEILDLGVDRDVLGRDAGGGSPPAALIVIDQPRIARQSVHLGQEIEMVEVGAAVEEEERSALAYLAYEEASPGNRNVALAHAARHSNPRSFQAARLTLMSALSPAASRSLSTRSNVTF